MKITVLNENRQPLPGASVTGYNFIGNRTGVSADSNGVAVIPDTMVASGFTDVTVSSVGYYEKLIGTPVSNMEVVLKKNTVELDDFVVESSYKNKKAGFGTWALILILILLFSKIK